MSDLDVLIRDSLENLASHEEPSPLLRARTLSKVRRRQQARKARRVFPAVAAAAVVAAILAVVLRPDDGKDVNITTDSTQMTTTTGLERMPNPSPDAGGEGESGATAIPGSSGSAFTPSATSLEPADAPLPGSRSPDTTATSAPTAVAPPTTPTTAFCAGDPCETTLGGEFHTSSTADSTEMYFTIFNRGAHTLFDATVTVTITNSPVRPTAPANCTIADLGGAPQRWLVSCDLGTVAVSGSAFVSMNVAVGFGTTLGLEVTFGGSNADIETWRL